MERVNSGRSSHKPPIVKGMLGGLNNQPNILNSSNNKHQAPVILISHLAWTGVNSEWVGKGSPVTKGEWFHGLGRLRDKLPLGHLCH